MTQFRCEELWRDRKHGWVSLRLVGGQKDFLRVWETGEVEWTWQLGNAAVLEWVPQHVDVFIEVPA